MDRRVVVGLVGFVLAGIAGVCPAQTGPGRDPSGQPSVVMTPIPSIGDSINNTTGFPAGPSSAASGKPGQGADAIIPKAPVPSDPVSMEPLDPIHRSIGRGFGPGSVSSIFRRPVERPILRATPRTEPAVKAEPWSASIRITPTTARPAPWTDQRPEAPRAQAESAVGPVDGRPSPFADDRPRSARPQAPSANVPAYRPLDVTPTGPVPVATPAPPEPPTEPSTTAAPLERPPALVLEAVTPPPAVMDPPPVGNDPLQGIATSPAPLPPQVVARSVPAPMPTLTDPNLIRTSREETAVRTNPGGSKPLPYATIRAAAVGDEIITINELATAVNDQMKDMLAGQQAPISDAELYQLKNQVAASVLDRLINQSLILQQANRKIMGNPKAKQAFDDFINTQWKTEELPPLLRKTATANVHELKIKLTAEGKSYDAMKEAFRKQLLSREFLRNEIRNKVTSDLVELKAYYNDHLDRFEQPARMTWREVEINVARYPNRAAARQKADEVLARLLRDEDFDAVARSVSNGPTASKGGLYVDMQPGSYGIPVVNDELNRLPTGQVSQVLEAPASFHIVRVDSRREKGPLRFDEVQDKIRTMVLEQNFQKAVEDYLAKIRAKTLIRTMFDQTASDPALARRNNDPAVRPASGTR